MTKSVALKSQGDLMAEPGAKDNTDDKVSIMSRNPEPRNKAE